MHLVWCYRDAALVLKNIAATVQPVCLTWLLVIFQFFNFKLVSGVFGHAGV